MEEVTSTVYATRMCLLNFQKLAKQCFNTTRQKVLTIYRSLNMTYLTFLTRNVGGKQVKHNFGSSSSVRRRLLLLGVTHPPCFLTGALCRLIFSMQFQDCDFFSLFLGVLNLDLENVALSRFWKDGGKENNLQKIFLPDTWIMYQVKQTNSHLHYYLVFTPNLTTEQTQLFFVGYN